MKTNEQTLTEVLKFISGYMQDNGYPPSVREICKGLDIASTATCYKYLQELEINGYIRKSKNRNRALEIIRGEYASPLRDMVPIPAVGKITAGKLKTAFEDYEDTYFFPSGLFSRGELFMLTIAGDSMIDAGIQDGDRIIVRRQPSAENGQIIAALVGDETTVKRLYKGTNAYILHPENKAYEDILVKELDILGIVVGLIRNY